MSWNKNSLGMDQQLITEILICIRKLDRWGKIYLIFYSQQEREGKFYGLLLTYLLFINYILVHFFFTSSELTKKKKEFVPSSRFHLDDGVLQFHPMNNSWNLRKWENHETFNALFCCFEFMWHCLLVLVSWICHFCFQWLSLLKLWTYCMV